MTTAETPPNDTRAEASVISAILNSAILSMDDVPGDVLAVVRPEDFYRTGHQVAMAAIRELYDRGAPTDLVMLCNHLKAKGQLRTAGGSDYLTRVMDDCPVSGDYLHHARIIKEKADARRMKEVLNRVDRHLVDGGPLGDAKKILLEGLEKIEGHPGEGPKVVNASGLLDQEPPAPDQMLEDIFDVGDKLAIIGSSKMRKSFFLLEMLICLAAGRTFLAWRVPQKRRVVHIQYEIQPAHFHRRLKRMCKALGVTAADLGDNLHIINARGAGLVGEEGIEKIAARVKSLLPEIISFDPLYKVAMGAENAAEDQKVVLGAFDRLTATGAAVAYVHHDAKGFSGDRDIRDRGAGSNVVGRDYDACITLTPHATETDAAVVEVLLRNYRPQEPYTILWHEDFETGGYRFDVEDSIAPTKRTSSNGKAKDEPALSTYIPAAVELLQDGPLPVRVFKDKFRAKTGLTHRRADAFRAWACAGSKPALEVESYRGRGKNEVIIRLSDHV